MKRWDILVSAALGTWALLSLGAPRLAGQPGSEPKAAYVGSSLCAGCHQPLYKEWEQLPHTRYLMAEKREAEGKGCEECHGPAGKHVGGDLKAIVSGKQLKPEAAAAMCLQCHRGVMKPQEWQTSAHGKARLTCTSCHSAHQAPKGPKMLRAPLPDQCLGCHPAQRAEFRQNSHHPVMEGRLACNDCHDPHRDGMGPALAHQTAERCTRCHTEKAGPFVYAHDTDSDDGCLACHRAHGSPHVHLQRLNGRGLCQQCHFDKITHNPGPACWTAGCHSQVHGSHQNQFFVR
ncbi:MAG: cytochrome c3 family protein [Armatimonadota bacterium]|nr:cytochrome c3 family protein [Armatimonadota bacterium]